MALPASGQISMSQVRSELGESGSISLGQSSVRNLAGVSSGSISMSDLYGSSNWDGNLLSRNEMSTNHFVAQGSNDPVAGLLFRNDGQIRSVQGTGAGASEEIGRWDGTEADSSNTEVQFDVTNGTASQNDAPNFASLSTSRQIDITTPVVGSTQEVYFTVRLRKTNDSGTEISVTDVALRVEIFN